ncbi:transglutaminaseTgpA domain-containing protein [Haloechinothrix alba]|nr:DUF3488 and transglutaminase-like domain-containing protein [Haloechinothrix alba]
MTEAHPGNAGPASRRSAAVRAALPASGLAAAATIASATALTSVIAGLSWLVPIAVAVLLVAGTGSAARLLGLPAVVVGPCQLIVLLLGVTAMFAEHGIAVAVPGPAALDELHTLLLTAGEEIRTGTPPIGASGPIVLLTTLAVGVVAVLVDTLAVPAKAPAAAGLALLCIYAIPASLSNQMLPWWSFVLGATAFAALITVHGSHRRWQTFHRHRSAREAVAAAAPVPVTLMSLAVVLGLVSGVTVTSIGTVGQLPSGSDEQGGVSSGMGITPFTSLRGMLNHDEEREMFRVRGLEDDRQLMRAFTLDTYRPDEGWSLADRDSLPAGLPATEPLPVPGGASRSPDTEITIQPVGWEDVWLPVYGEPSSIDGIDDRWHYDTMSGTVFSEHRERPPTYSITTSLRDARPAELRAAEPDPGAPASVYTEVDDVDPRVAELAEEVTAGEESTFDQAAALWRYFTEDGRFTYDTSTAPPSEEAANDALADFVLFGRTGFCEQFASSMAVMLRAIDIPARVAVGFTSGEKQGEHRSITSRDAHAWVEVYFGEQHGWMPFDPTPLDDGRSTTPLYLEGQRDSSGREDDAAAQGPQERDGNTDDQAAAPPEDSTTAGNRVDAGSLPTGAPPTWSQWLAGVSLALATALGCAAVLAARSTSRLRRRPDGVRPGARYLSLAAPWLPVGAAACGVLGLAMLSWQLSGWLAWLVAVLAGGAVAPWLLREIGRRRRLHTLLSRRADAADAAWQELIAECADRRIPIGIADTVRDAALRMGEGGRLGADGQQQLHAVVTCLERSWYGPAGETSGDLAAAYERLRASLASAAPVDMAGRLFPRSVVGF